MEYVVRSRDEWLRLLNELDPEVGVVMLVAGLVYVLMGWRIFKALVVLNCAFLGAAIGWGVGVVIDDSTWMWSAALGLAGALLLGASAMLLVKVAVLLSASLVGFYVGAVVASMASAVSDVQLVGGLVGLAIVASLVYVLFDHIVIATLSFQGALMSVSGAIVAVSGQMNFLRYFREMAADSAFFIPFCVIALTVIGVSIQLAGLREAGASQAVK